MNNRTICIIKNVWGLAIQLNDVAGMVFMPIQVYFHEMSNYDYQTLSLNQFIKLAERYGCRDFYFIDDDHGSEDIQVIKMKNVINTHEEIVSR